MSEFYHPLPDAAKQRLDRLYQGMQGHAQSFVGYPCNTGFDYSELYRFLGMSVNNLGDPFASSNYRVNSLEIEKELMEEMAKLYHAPVDDFWGYITNGGTEGNMYGLFLARELHPSGIVYYSEDTHYSVSKIMHVLGARSIMIKSQDNGEMDYEDLRETLRIHRDVPPIIFANIGTTMKGAVDNLTTIRGIIQDMAISRYYIHADCALSGMILPFVPDAQPFDFRAGIDSMSVSGHKLIGSPIPCGIVLAKRTHVNRIARSVEYVGAVDTTIMGSRNGISPLFLWYAWQRMGRNGLTQLVNRCLQLTAYAVEKMQAAGIPAWAGKNSITVVFPRPGEHVLRHWQIAPYKDIGHIITLPHVHEEVIDRLIADMLAEKQQKAA